MNDDALAGQLHDIVSQVQDILPISPKHQDTSTLQ